jgi:hypothetical protein
VESWTDRPDARAPAGLSDDVILPPRAIEVIYTARVTTHEDILFGTDEIPPILVLQDWDMVPLSMTVTRHEFEVRGGVLSWLGISLLVPLQHTSVEFTTGQITGTPTSLGLGDLELRALYSLHDTWPYRAHLVGGISLPTGAVSHEDTMPDRPSEDATLPYPMQPSDGTFALMPGAVFVAENAAGTVGIRADARIPIGENGRDWTRGQRFTGNVWMAYRFTDWVSGSVRVTFRRTGNVEGFDPALNAFGSPMAIPQLQGGTRVDVPIGVNFMFPEGPLSGNRLGGELILPVHQDLDGPQIAAGYGVALSWGVAF